MADNETPNEVEAALAELREMFPSGGVQIRHDIWYPYNKPDVRHDDFTIFADGVPLHPVKAKTLADAMTAVRKYHEESK